jgi:DNA repair exonuclease SbcCD ATPase subunit
LDGLLLLRRIKNVKIKRHEKEYDQNEDVRDYSVLIHSLRSILQNLEQDQNRLRAMDGTCQSVSQKATVHDTTKKSGNSEQHIQSTLDKICSFLETVVK